MSRLLVLLVALMGLQASPARAMCPGTFTIGLPLLFGCDGPNSVGLPPTPLDGQPIIDLKLGGEEAQEYREPPARSEMARECLKVWRQLVSDGRFDLAPAVAAKAAALDPSSAEAQHAVVVSQVLRTIDHRQDRETPVAQPRLFATERPGADCENTAIVDAALKQLFPQGLLNAGTTSRAMPACCKEACKMACEDICKDAGSSCCKETQFSMGPIKLMSHTTTVAAPAKRVTVKTGTWHCECDRIVTMNDREIVLEGNVTMRRQETTVEAGRVRINLADGTLQVDGSATEARPTQSGTIGGSKISLSFSLMGR